MVDNASISDPGRPISTQLNSILCRDERASLVLLDLPRSVSAAQVSSNQQNTHSLISCEPLKEAYLSTEPKTGSASRRLEKQTSSLIEAKEHEDLIQTGLKWICEHYDGLFCLPRIVQSPSQGSSSISHTREGDHSKTSTSKLDEPSLHSKPLNGVAVPIELLESQVHRMPSSETLQTLCVLNPHCSTSSLYISATDATYYIPPFSSFMLTSLSAQTSSLLSIALLSIAPDVTETAQAGGFDLILLDPPWPNRSARRATPYHCVSTEEDPFCGFGDVLPQHLAAGGFVACWITHAQVIRERVEAAFERWDLDIVEEWTWAKVTSRGKPMIALGSRWRRGWEVLVIGRKRDAGIVHAEHQRTTTRRLVFTVPDLHSRKPCLKELFERTLLKGHKDARVLEVFARHLVAGWCSIGDQVLRFNWDGHWAAQALSV